MKHQASLLLHWQPGGSHGHWFVFNPAGMKLVSRNAKGNRFISHWVNGSYSAAFISLSSVFALCIRLFLLVSDRDSTPIHLPICGQTWGRMIPSVWFHFGDHPGVTMVTSALRGAFRDLGGLVCEWKRLRQNTVQTGTMTCQHSSNEIQASTPTVVLFKTFLLHLKNTLECSQGWWEIARMWLWVQTEGQN